MTEEQGKLQKAKVKVQKAKLGLQRTEAGSSLEFRFCLLQFALFVLRAM
jgi:hypothetical protein